MIKSKRRLILPRLMHIAAIVAAEEVVVSSGNDWKRASGYRRLEGMFLVDFLPRDVARLLAQRGWLSVADVLRAAIEAEEVDRKPIEEMKLSTYIVRRLKSRGYETVGSTDGLTEERVLVYIYSLGKRAVREINEARIRFGKMPIART